MKSSTDQGGSTALPAPAPAVNEETQAFWDATVEGRFLLRRCVNGHVIWYPRSLCPVCKTTDVEWVDASGRGVVYSFTVVRKSRGPYAGAAPYVVAYVELDEGPRVLTNLVDVDVDEVAIGMPVEVVWHDTGEGSALYRFAPAG